MDMTDSPGCWAVMGNDSGGDESRVLGETKERPAATDDGDARARVGEGRM